MGRYTTVQAYGDSNPNMRAVSYEQAVGGKANGNAGGNAGGGGGGGGELNKANGGGNHLKTEKVSNPYGSTAGAGSGEFHVYRHARSREMERLKTLDKDEEERLAEQEFRAKLSRDANELEHKTDKRRCKRQRALEAKRRKKVMQQNGLLLVDNDATKDGQMEDYPDETFEYTAKFKLDVNVRTATESVSTEIGTGAPEESNRTEPTIIDGEQKTITTLPDVPIKNDGSFLETMMRLQQQNKL
jgi:hypothetical protein